MLKELEKLGLLKKTDGSIDEKTKIMLLHIYKCRFEKKKTDVSSILQDIKSGRLNSYSQLLDMQTKDFFVDGFDSGIELMHSALREKGKSASDEQKSKQYRAFANACDNIQKLEIFQDGYGPMWQTNEDMALKFLPTATTYILNQEIIFGDNALQKSF